MMWNIGLIIFWLFYFPLMLILQILLFMVPKLRERRKFEARNNSEQGAGSFRHENVKADLCFEFSSEGEYQQVASLIDDALAMGKKLELVFFSPSVEKTILDLHKRFPNQIRYLRYPVLLPVFSNWVTSRTLILVRYDFFPEFLLWSLKPGHQLKLIWMTFKKERIQRKPISWFKRAFLKNSDFTIFASEPDYELGQKLGAKGAVYDFRMEQIKRRVDSRVEKFNKLFPQYPDLKKTLENYPRGKRLIVGNAWPEDMKLLENLPSDVILVIVPHQLKPEIIQQMQDALTKVGRLPVVMTDQASNSNTIILNKKGVLCELYADFGKAYVGGGFGVSVHSILEPLVAGSEHIACGPVNHRSTEFDLARSYGQMKEVKNSQEFLNWLAEDVSAFKVHDKLKSQIAAYPQYQKEVLSC